MKPEAILPSEKIRAPLIIVTSAILVAIHRQFGSMEFITGLYPGMTSDLASAYFFGSTFLLFALIPLLVARTALGLSMREIGVQMGDWRFGLKTVLVLLPLLLIVLMPTPYITELGKVYPLDKTAGDSLGAFLRHELLRALLFYASWEFLFRGVMIFGLVQDTGKWVAVCVQVIPSSLWHLGGPPSELFASIAAGVLLGMLALRTRSIFWSWILHFLIGLIVDIYLLTA